MQATVSLTRIGSCNGCGECCSLFNGFRSVLCQNYLLSDTQHCLIYSHRPDKCRNFPKGPHDLVAMPHCGFQFVDAETGQVVDAFMLLATEGHYRRASKHLTELRNKL